METAKHLLTPRDLAEAIGASESSVRRWVDNGQIHIARTAGGHRRIPVGEAVRFIRRMGLIVVHPEKLGLRNWPSDRGADIGAADMDQPLYAALLAGDAPLARGLILSAFLAGGSLGNLLDGPVRLSLHRLGELWQHDSRGILVEHRAIEIARGILNELQGLLPATADGAALAVGGAPEGDPYVLPSQMAGLVLQECGYRAINFGANTPVELVTEWAIERRAELLWVSLTAPIDVEVLRQTLGEVAVRLDSQGCALVVGGRHAGEVVDPADRGRVHHADSMAELARFAKSRLAKKFSD